MPHLQKNKIERERKYEKDPTVGWKRVKRGEEEEKEEMAGKYEDGDFFRGGTLGKVTLRNPRTGKKTLSSDNGWGKKRNPLR